MTRKLNHWIGLSLLLMAMSFFFYKSIISEQPFKQTMVTLEKIHNLQIQLHRDILRHRNGQMNQYDNLNNTAEKLHQANQQLNTEESISKFLDVSQAIVQLKSTISYQEELVENYKTHHSILQNSLTYYSRMSEEIYGKSDTGKNIGISKQVLGRLSTLVLEYTRIPKHETAVKIFPIIDSLNHNPSREVNTLINHSLMIIERLPEIDAIITTFNTINTEEKITDIKAMITSAIDEHDENSIVFSSLLFICSLYLIAYIVLLFITIQKNRNTLASANESLNKEVNERSNTERTLYSFVEGASGHNEDSIYAILNSLCTSLNVRYAYLTYFSKDMEDANVIGLIDDNQYITNIKADLKNSPCEEVLKEGRLVHNRNLPDYYPDWDKKGLAEAVSYIGVTIQDNHNNVKGLLAVADDSPIDNSNLAESIISLAASRASTELLRQISLRESKRYQDGLELIDHWIARIVAVGTNIDLFFDNTCVAAHELTNASISLLPILNRQDKTYQYVATMGEDTERYQNLTMSLDDGGICSWAMKNKSTLRVDDVRSDIRTVKQQPTDLKVKSALVTPIVVKNKAYGSVIVYKENDIFDEIDELLLTQFSQSVQMAVINMHLLSDIESERERAEVTLHSIADAVITTNVDGNIEYINHIAELLTGWSLQEVKNKPVQIVFRILDRDTREPMHDLIGACLEDGTAICKSMTTLIAKDSSEKEIESSMSPIIRSNGKTDGAVIVFHDETERRHMEHVIMHQATHDSLTGLTNRNEFDRQLNEHVYDAKNYGREHALCYLDLDRFKLVNDTSGHAAGDELLKQMTTLLHTCIRGGDILGRLGGDEFGLVLENCPPKSAERIAKKIVKAISSHQFSWDNTTFSIGVSIGMVSITYETESASEIMKQADLACYTAKDNGRNRVYIYENEDTELIRRKEEMFWATRIEDALDNDRLKLYAQTICPISNSNSGRIHLEILSRLDGENGQLIQPNAFIPAAERFNLMGIIDRRIIRDTFAFIASRKKHIRDNVSYSINLSGNSLNDDRLATFIKSQFDEYEISPSLICFEITETATISNLIKARTLIVDLKNFGCSFALDDFGSGLSSFEYLKNLPVDYLKIDGCFVRDMVNNKIDHAMVAAINQIGHVMDIQTIAEFVESDDIIHKLKALNVDYAQGYAISHPIPLGDVDIDGLSSPLDLSSGCA